MCAHIAVCQSRRARDFAKADVLEVRAYRVPGSAKPGFCKIRPFDTEVRCRASDRAAGMRRFRPRQDVARQKPQPRQQLVLDGLVFKIVFSVSGCVARVTMS
jgi:hypothetical protein